MPTLTIDALEALVTRAFVRNATSPDAAVAVARALASAEVDGQKGHGLSRVALYCAQARAGKINGHAVPTVRTPRPAALMIDAAHGFSYPALDLAIAGLPSLANAHGLAAAGIVRSSHAGVIGRHVERLAEQGLVAFAFANTPKAMAPWGGRRSLFGTNPIGFAAPQRGQAPLVIDMALSEVARGKILVAAQKGEAIPASWAVDADGQPTTDASAALKGALQPAGGSKGAALALMVEVMAAALTGANLSRDATSFFDADGAPPSVGQFVIAIAPEAFGGGDTFGDRIAALADAVLSDQPARLPGSRRLALRAAAKRDGIAVDDALHAAISALADRGP